MTNRKLVGVPIPPKGWTPLDDRPLMSQSIVIAAPAGYFQLWLAYGGSLIQSPIVAFETWDDGLVEWLTMFPRPGKVEAEAIQIPAGLVMATHVVLTDDGKKGQRFFGSAEEWADWARG